MTMEPTALECLPNVTALAKVETRKICRTSCPWTNTFVSNTFVRGAGPWQRGKSRDAGISDERLETPRSSGRLVHSPYTQRILNFLFSPVLFQLPRTERRSRLSFSCSHFTGRPFAFPSYASRNEKRPLKSAGGGSRRPPRVLIKTKRRIKIPRLAREQSRAEYEEETGTAS